MIDFHNHIGLSLDGGESKLEDLIAVMDESGIEKSVVFPIDSEDQGITYEKPNDMIYDCYQKHPNRLIPFCRVQPKAQTKALDEIKRCLDKGFKGIKLHPHSDKFWIEDVIPIFNLANELGTVVILHTDHHPHKSPDYWEGAFSKYANAKFVMAHGGRDKFRLASAIAARYANVWLDTSTQSFRRTQLTLELAGADKVLFATDYPYSHTALEKKKYELLIQDEETREKVYRKNALKVLSQSNE